MYPIPRLALGQVNRGRGKREMARAKAIYSCLGARKKAAWVEMLLRAAISGKLHGKILSKICKIKGEREKKKELEDNAVRVRRVKVKFEAET